MLVAYAYVFLYILNNICRLSNKRYLKGKTMDMNIILWIAQGLLAFAFFGAGMMKVTQPKEKLLDKMTFVEDFPENTVRVIGALEVTGAIGLILPLALGILPILTPLAGVGLFLTMIGAIITHLRRNEIRDIVPNIVLGLIALFIVYGRFVIVPYTG